MLCFRKFPVTEKIMDKRGGGSQDFPLKFSCLTMPKTFAREPLFVVFQKTFGSEKDYG